MENKSTNPEIRFDGFKEDWEEKKLESICANTYGGGTPSTSNAEFWSGNIVWLQSSDLVEGQVFDVIPRKKISKNGVSSSAAKIIPANSIAIVTRVGVGKMAIIPYEYATSQDFLSLTSLKIDKMYATYSVWNKIQSELHSVQGTSIKGITKEELLSKKITITSNKTEQSQIGTNFKHLDHLINLHQKKHEKLSRVKKAMLEKMFPKKGAYTPEIRFEGFDDKWEEKNLGEVVDFYSGLTYSPNDIVKKDGTLVLRSSNVKNGEIIQTDNVFVKNNVINCQNVKIGDIIVVVRNGSRSLIGKHAQIKEKMDNTVIGAFMTGISSEQPSFINALLDSPRFIKEVEKNLGATINQITTGAFKNMEFLFPTNKEQIKIGQYFNKLDNLITQHNTQIEKLKNIKKALLEKMFV